MTSMKVWVMFVEKPWKIWRNWEKSLGPSKVIIVPRSLDVVSINIIDLFFGTGNWTRTLINSKPAAKKQRNFSCVHNKPCLLNAALKRVVAEILFGSHFPNVSSLSLLTGVFGVTEIVVGSFCIEVWESIFFITSFGDCTPRAATGNYHFPCLALTLGSFEALVSFWEIEGNSLS